jgi:HAD superfamily hydrolase (TIGR01509 family)
LLFDFDGLILDTETPELLSWQVVWHDHGLEFPLDRFEAGLGMVGGFGAMTALEEAVGPLDREAVLDRQRKRKLSLLDKEALRPGVLEYLDEARRRGLVTAIVSSSSRAWIDSNLGRLDPTLEVDVIVTGDHDRQRGKPSPALYLEALDQLGLTARESVAFEDTPIGVRAARAAEIFCVAVPNDVTSALDFGEANLLVASLADLPFASLLDQFSRSR